MTVLLVFEKLYVPTVREYPPVSVVRYVFNAVKLAYRVPFSHTVTSIAAIVYSLIQP